MSNSGMFSALVLSVGLSACAHGAPVEPAPISGGATYNAQSGEVAGFKRLHAAYLAFEQRQHVSTSGGAVVVEHRNCDVWSDDPSARCDLSVLASESMAQGLVSTP